MTLNELQRWILNHDQEDTWWVAVDGEVQDNLMALPDVGKVKDQYPNNEVSVLHATKADEDDAEWIIFEKDTAQKFRIISEKAIAKQAKMPAAPEPKEAEPEPEPEPAAEEEPKKNTAAKAEPTAAVDNEHVQLMQAEMNALKLAVAKLNEEVGELRNLADEVKEPLAEARAVLAEREQFLETSENSLFEKAQNQEVIQQELEQAREELQDKETSLKEREKAVAEKESA